MEDICFYLYLIYMNSLMNFDIFFKIHLLEYNNDSVILIDYYYYYYYYYLISLLYHNLSNYNFSSII